MAAVGAGVTGSWFLSSGPVSFFILLLLLTVFLMALCSDCRRHSFDLQDSETDNNPLGLIRVVKLEEAIGVRENPAINEIQSDEENPASVTAWRSHLGAPQNHRDVQTNGSAAELKTTGDSDAAVGGNSVPLTPWRNHLWAPQNQDLNSPTPPDSAHILHVIGGGRSSSSSDADLTSSTNQETEEENSTRSEAATDRNSVYSRVSKKVKPTTKPTTPPSLTPEEVQEEEEEEALPPVPDRSHSLRDDGGRR